MSPLIKFEASPTESSIDHFDASSPTAYPPLFGTMDTLNPSEIDGSEYDYGDYEGFENMSNSASTPSSGTPQPQEKKMVKKRKSWGQQLPEPKTNLPPRKRAKTEDEKEQRRVERVLRNRRAAQSSRERKRQEVEALEAEKLAIERKNRDLEMRLAEAEARNLALEQQLVELSNSSSPYSHQSSPVQPKQVQASPRQVTLSQPLFSTNESNSFQSTGMDHLNHQSSLQPQTVNPASLSPESGPVAEASNASSSDMTQHSAAVLWDLQCQSEEQRPWMASNPASLSTLLLLLSLISTTTLAILSPLSRIISSSRTRSCPSPAASSFNTIIWLLTTTTPPPLPTSTSISTTSSSEARTRPWTRPRFGLRRGVLRRLLACSPHLARPLMDATVSAMRLASEQPISSMSGDVARPEDTRPASSGEEVIPVKVLAALLWATHVIDRDYQRRAATLAADVDAATRRHRAVGMSGLLGGKMGDDRFRFDWPASG